MLTTRASKRDKVGFFNTEVMFDVLDGDRQVGTLVYAKKVKVANIVWENRTYTIERLRNEPDDNLLKQLRRLIAGSGKPPPNPWQLKDSTGKVLAVAEQIKISFAVSRGEESFTFRKVKWPYHLFRKDSEQSLGTVGQDRFFTKTMHMDLPAEFDPPFQMFMLSLVLIVAMEQMENNNSN
jgi:hypothetical protein